jgi:hypothetical protein
MVIVRCSGRHPDFIKRVIKRVNVERGNVGSKQRSDERGVEFKKASAGQTPVIL